MKAVIIAGGLGTRLRPLTYNIPKPVVPVANRPFVLHQLDLLRQHGIKEVVLNLHYLMDSIKQVLEDGRKLGLKVHYSIEEQPLGTAGAVKNAEQYFDDEPLLVFNGDVLTDINLSQIIEFHRKTRARATLTLTRVTDPTAYGLILTNREGVVTHFVEKPSWEQLANFSALGPADTINAGIYVLDPKIFRSVPAGVEHSFERQLFPALLAKGELLCGYISDRYWIDIGQPSQYRQAHEAILRGEVAVKIHGTRTDGRLWIGDRAKIDKTARLLGPAIVGREVEIGAETRVKDYTILGDGVAVGRDCSLASAIVWAGTRFGNHVSLDNCIIGSHCLIEDRVTIGGGVVLADNSHIRKGSIICSR